MQSSSVTGKKKKETFLVGKSAHNSSFEHNLLFFFYTQAKKRSQSVSGEMAEMVRKIYAGEKNNPWSQLEGVCACTFAALDFS